MHEFVMVLAQRQSCWRPLPDADSRGYPSPVAAVPSPHADRSTHRHRWLTIAVQATDSVLRGLVRDHWGAFRVELSRLRQLGSVFRCPGAAPARKFNRWHAAVTDRFLFSSDRTRYVSHGLTCASVRRSRLPSARRLGSRFAYYHVIGPLMLDLLKRCSVLVWHGAAVARTGRAVLLSGVSGSASQRQLSTCCRSDIGSLRMTRCCFAGVPPASRCSGASAPYSSPTGRCHYCRNGADCATVGGTNVDANGSTVSLSTAFSTTEGGRQ